MTDKVTRQMPIDELQKLATMAHNALSPLIKYDEDIDEMKKARDEEREKQLYLILGTVQRYL